MRGKVVIITGGSSGIGKALAAEFGLRGARVMITGRNGYNLEKAANELSAKGVEVIPFRGDVGVEDDNRRMAELAIEKFGTIDILINNAGISMRALFEEADLDVVRRVMDTNFWGMVYATKYCMPEIIRNKGSIIGVSSVAGFRGLPGRTGYSASKFALNGFLEALRLELAPKGTHVLTACPGFTSTNIRVAALTKNGATQGQSPREENHMMSAEACAHYIYAATVKRKRTLILTTQGKLTVFMNKWLPGLVDRVVFNIMSKEANSPF
ncbi:SDR family oxidoreductase [Chryseolinea sp. T2]|uniref:SDR family oxidoreductase n=1 Tax=Chryseolinea sp. T2 TaxID=3129255 RepID=UPI00307899A5